MTGSYRFGIMVDDAGWLKIDGQPVIADPGDVTKEFDSGEIYLTAGKHRIELGERNIWGGASMRFYGGRPAVNRKSCRRNISFRNASDATESLTAWSKRPKAEAPLTILLFFRETR